MTSGRPPGAPGPLFIYAEGFREYLEGRGYTAQSADFRLRQLATLDRWLRDRQLTAADVDAACVGELVASRRAAGRKTFVAAANFSVPVAYLRQIGVVSPESVAPLDSVGKILEQYRRYLAVERGLVGSSVSANVHIAESFCRTRDVPLGLLSAAEVTTYIAQFCARSSVGWSKRTVSALASFLRFLHVAGVTSGALVAAVPKVGGYRPVVPCELGEADFARLLAGCDCSRDVGLRDSAILTIMWRLGLRRSEVAGLRLDDLDWRHGQITIRGKGNRHELLPIPIDVGETLVRYLQETHRRIPPGCRALFVQVRAPEGPMTPDGISDVVTRVSRRVGMPVIGAHQLRHGTATQLVRDGASWSEIAQLLRHRTVAVTVSYATVDATLLRELARPWPGAR
jgi:integrase/recombinase XerD